jgi:hypothetical protein
MHSLGSVILERYSSRQFVLTALEVSIYAEGRIGMNRNIPASRRQASPSVPTPLSTILRGLHREDQTP